MTNLELITRSTARGAIAGAALAIIYTLIAIPVVGLLLVISNIPIGKAFDAMIGAGIFAICAWPFAIVLGVIPGVLLGAVGGLGIGAGLPLSRERTTARPAAWLGFAIALGIVLIGHLFIAPGLIETQFTGLRAFIPYLFWLFGPSLMLVLGLTWAGWHAYDNDPLPRFWRRK
ncbi:MAG: hypothetical protein KIH69_016975 [Anaerolineae bacterium]|nr:hypothetical protein [Anaerolineae bacterium]